MLAVFDMIKKRRTYVDPFDVAFVSDGHGVGGRRTRGRTVGGREKE